MATVNLGRIKPVFRGAYNNSTAYVIDDIVTASNETFIAIAATQGNATTDASKWTKLAAKGADGADGTDVAATLANKEIAFKTNAGALDGIPIGTAGQALKVNSGATGYEFGVAGGLLQVKTFRKTSGWSQGANSTDRVEAAPFDGTASITPSATNSIIMAYIHIVVKHGTTWRSGVGRLQFSTDGGSNYSDFGMMTSSAYNGGTNMSGNDYAGMFVIPNQNTTNAHKVRFYHMPHDNGHNNVLGGSIDTSVSDTTGNVSTYATGATLTLFEYAGAIATLSTTA